MSEAEDSGLRVVGRPYVPLTDAEGRSTSRLQPYPPMLHPCRLCPSRCCYLPVKVAFADVIHYCETLEVPFFAGFTFEHGGHPRRQIRLDRDDRFTDPEDGWVGFGELRLRRNADGGCASLKEVGGYWRCGVYDARPRTCRLYPVTYRTDGGVGGPNAVLCPAPYAVTPEMAQQAEEDIKIAERNWQIHELVAEEWNKAHVPDRSLERALEFILTRTAEHLERSLPPVILALGTPEERLNDELVARRMTRAAKGSTDTRAFAGLPNVGRPL